MWCSTTFKVALVKYQEKDSVDLGDSQVFVDNFVKNKYEDLFGDDENIESNEMLLESPTYGAEGLYPVYESDAIRKYISPNIEFKGGTYYYKGTMIADNLYTFTNSSLKNKIVYQHKYCGDAGVISFIVTPAPGIYEGKLFECGNILLKVNQNMSKFDITLVNTGKTLSLTFGDTYFVFIRWSRELNTVEMSAAKYVHANLPIYRLQNHHYWFDIDNLITVVSKYNIEMQVEKQSDIVLHSMLGTITNIKVFNYYNDNISEILQMYPTNQHLIVNDTARKLIDMTGIATS